MQKHGSNPSLFAFFYFSTLSSGTARTQVPTTKNCALDIPALGVFARVSHTEVQWRGLAQEEPPSWSRYPPRQVSYEKPRARVGFNWFLAWILHARNFLAVRRPLAGANRYVASLFCRAINSCSLATTDGPSPRTAEQREKSRHVIVRFNWFF